MDFLPFQSNESDVPANTNGVATNDEIPQGELDIFFRDESQFMPPGKKWADLSAEEQKLIRNRYRFDPLKPGCYQGITAITSKGVIPTQGDNGF